MTAEPAHLVAERSAAAAAAVASNGDRATALADQLAGKVLRGDEILAVTRPEPLVAGLLDLAGFAVLFGRPKSGKSFVALDLAACVATGSWWHDREVTAGNVLYVIAEGTGGMPERYAAWKAHNRVYSDLEGLFWLPERPNLRMPDQAHAVAEVAATIEPSLIVIDTLNRTMGGGNENGPEDMGAYIAGVDRIRETTGATVLVVHHSGKDQSAGARGHSSLLGALDTELEVKNGGDGIITLTVTAQKDHAGPPPLRLTLVPVGDSCAVADYTGRAGDDRAMLDTDRRVLAVLRAIRVPGGVSATEWQTATEADGITRPTFFRARSRLAEHGQIRNLGTESRPRWMPVDDEENPES